MTQLVHRSSPDVGSADALPIRTENEAIVVEGAVDLFTEARFRRALTDATDDPSISVVDLSGISFFGVAGIDPLVDFSKCFRGRVSISTSVARTLALLDVDIGPVDVR